MTKHVIVGGCLMGAGIAAMVKFGLSPGPQYFWYGVLIGMGFCIHKFKDIGFRAFFCGILIGCSSFCAAAAFYPGAAFIFGLSSFLFLGAAYRVGLKGVQFEAAS